MQAPAWLSHVLATNAPALPQAWAMQGALTFGWALVLALLGALLGSRLTLVPRRLLAAALALSTLLPGALSPDYWLGLAFHAPSLLSMLLCVLYLQRLLFPARPTVPALLQAAGPTPVAAMAQGLFAALAVALGYVLLLDTFAVLPLEVYAWGFSPALLLGLLALSLAPWVWRGPVAVARGPGRWLAPAALLLFAATRLPTGNVWDAVLDPWLWLLLQFALLRRLFRRQNAA